jgi:putative FmdB family regulatory protein
MPLYDFDCAGCGPFEQWRPASEPTADCPACGAPARRRYAAFAVTRPGAPLRRAREREEKSAHAPEVVSKPTGRPLHLHHHGHAH